MAIDNLMTIGKSIQFNTEGSFRQMSLHATKNIFVYNFDCHLPASSLNLRTPKLFLAVEVEEETDSILPPTRDKYVDLTFLVTKLQKIKDGQTQSALNDTDLISQIGEVGRNNLMYSELRPALERRDYLQ